MKMNKPTKPTPEDFAAFAKQIHDAGRDGINVSTLFQRNAPMRRWLEHILDYLPPDLKREHVSCVTRDRGVLYRSELGEAKLDQVGCCALDRVIWHVRSSQERGVSGSDVRNLSRVMRRYIEGGDYLPAYMAERGIRLRKSPKGWNYIHEDWDF